MKWCVESAQGKLIEVVDLFDHEGKKTEALWAAEACVLSYLGPDGLEFQSLSVPFGSIFRLQ